MQEDESDDWIFAMKLQQEENQFYMGSSSSNTAPADGKLKFPFTHKKTVVNY